MIVAIAVAVKTTNPRQDDEEDSRFPVYLVYVEMVGAFLKIYSLLFIYYERKINISKTCDLSVLSSTTIATKHLLQQGRNFSYAGDLSGF